MPKKLNKKSIKDKIINTLNHNDKFISDGQKYDNDDNFVDEKVIDDDDDFEREDDDQDIENVNIKSDSEDSESDIDSLDEKEIDDDKKEKDDETEYDEEKCIYNYADDRSDGEEEIEFEFDDDMIQISENIVNPEKRITKPFLTKYERVRILGDRIQQLTLGAKPMIKNSENLSPKEIAELELKNNVIPLIIVRPLANGEKEKWYIKELKH